VKGSGTTPKAERKANQNGAGLTAPRLLAWSNRAGQRPIGVLREIHDDEGAPQDELFMKKLTP
jgi:hypothetical protein